MDDIHSCRSRSIVLFAVQSRIFVFILQFFFNYLIPDHNAEVFNPGASKNDTVLDKIASHIFDGLSNRWDGIYFMHIAEHGYTYENTLVFFPLFPLLTKLLALSLLFPLQYIFSFRSVLHFSATLLNFFAFLCSAYYIYKLGCSVIKCEHVAYRAAQLFCVNPASVFFSATYSESLFSALTFAGLLNLHEGKCLKASCLFAFSGATRSNGIINAGFILYFYLTKLYNKTSLESIWENYTFEFIKKYDKLIFGFCNVIKELLFLLVLMFASVSLFLSHQAYCYLMYCHDMKHEFRKTISENLIKYGKAQGYNMPGLGPQPSWCQNEIPLSYSKIQEQHWNVGLFRYYKLNQLPNFFLALPMLAISMSLCTKYFVHKPLFCLLLGMVPKRMKNKSSERMKNLKRSVDDYPLVFFYQDILYVYVVQLGILTIFGAAYMHIQVITRMICSSCPVFYWYLAEQCMTKEEKIAMEVVHHKKHLNLSGKKVFDCMRCEALKSDDEDFHCIAINQQIGKMQNYKQLRKFQDENVSCATRKRYVEEQIGLSNECLEISDSFGDDALVEVFKDSEVIDWNEGLFNKLISVYFHLYLFVGVAAFSNFFPWT